MKQAIRLFALVVAAALSSQALAHDKAHDKKAHNKGQAEAGKTAKSEFLGKGDGIEFCPVTGEKITSKDVKGEFFKRTVYFCCDACLEEAKKNPALYVKSTEAAQIAATKNLPKNEGHHGDHHAQDPKESEKKDPEKKEGEKKFLGRGDGIETCPVMGTPVNKKTKFEVNGRDFYVCCPGCAETVKENPDLYLKPIEGEKKPAVK